MDPISHLLFGKTLNNLQREDRRTRAVAVALVAGSFLPDVDIVLLPFGFDFYLTKHEAGTHSLLGSVIEAGVLAGLLWWLFKGPRCWKVFLATWIGALGHIFWDMADGGEIRFLTPFYDERLSLHLVSMWDPLLMVPLAVCSVFMVLKPKRSRSWAVVTLVLLGSLLGVKAWSKEASKAVFAREVLSKHESIEVHTREEIWCSVFQWRYLTQQEGSRGAWGVNVLRGEAQLLFERPYPHDSELISVSKEFPVVQRALYLSDLPVVWVQEKGELSEVHWSDMKFCRRAGCKPSFGVVFDARGTSTKEFIVAGSFRQERPIVARER